MIHGLESFLFYNGIGSLVAYIGCIALGILTIIKNPRNKLNITFSIIAFLGSLWNIVVYFIIQATVIAEATFSWKLYSVITITLLSLVTYFCSELSNRKASLPLILLTPILLTPLILFTDIFISGAQNINNHMFQTKTQSFVLLELYRLIMISTALFYLHNGYKYANENIKNKIKLVSIGIGSALIVAIFDVSVRLIGGNILPFSSIATILTVGFIGYSFQKEDAK